MLFFKVGHLFFILFIGICCALLLEIITNTLLGLLSGKRRGDISLSFQSFLTHKQVLIHKYKTSDFRLYPFMLLLTNLLDVLISCLY